LVLLTLILVSFVSRDVFAANNSSFFIIINAKNPIESLDRKFIADVYLKKITHWPEDGIIQPIDLTPDAPARNRFSEEILNRSVMGVKNYWQQLIFSGQDVPPPELRTDSEVIQYIVKNQSSIGYISAAAASNASPEMGIKMVDIK